MSKFSSPTREEGSDAIMLISLSVCLCVCAGADPEISFGGPRGAEGTEVERHRREDQGAEGVFPCPPGEGSGKGAVPPPQKIFSILHYKMACFGRF